MQVWRERMAGRVALAAASVWLALCMAPKAQDVNVPLPPPRPDRPQAASPEGARDQQTSEEAGGKQQNAESGAQCRERIAKLGVTFEVRPTTQENDCRIQTPVLVSGLPVGIAVSPGSLMECSLAEGLARWVKEVVVAEAERHLQNAPTKLLIGTSYQCRPQRSGGKLSEHGLGNAVDVMGFEFAKREPLAIGSHAEGSPEASFQSAIRTGACPIFSTVLGPGSDAAHGEHLHLDMRARKGDYRICQ